MATSLNLTNSQDCPLAFNPKDKKGQPATIDGVPEWFSDNTDVLTVVADADGKTAVVSGVGPAGTVNISVTADADMGAGVTPIVGVLQVNVSTGQAVVIDIQPGTPVEQP